MTSEVTLRAKALVADRLPEARRLGLALAELTDDPEGFANALRQGFQRLADPEYAREVARIAPSPLSVIGVRNPLVAAVEGQLRRPVREASAASALWLAQRLAGEPEREMRLFSHSILGRALKADPERSWQLMRQLAHAAADWICVDHLAWLYAQGIVAENYRWAELEQLVYSGQRWERRLVGSTIATIPQVLPRDRRAELAKAPGLTLIKSLIGDAEPDVQKALSWALRSWWQVDPFGTREVLRAESMRAKSDNDGHRAWVVRDALTLPGIDSGFVAELRERLDGIRRKPGAQSTSDASAMARHFTGLANLSRAAAAHQGSRF